MLFVEEEAVLSPEHTRAGGATDEVSERVSADRRDGQNRRQRVNVEVPLGGKQAGRNEQRVTGQEHSDQESGLGEDNGGEAEEASPLDEIRRVRDPLEEVAQRLHRAGLENH